MASSRRSGGRIPGIRRASMVLPPPGGPIMSIECPPAAATSSARRADPLAADLGHVGPRRRRPSGRGAPPASSGDRLGSARPSSRSTAARRVGRPEHLDAGHEGGLGGVGARAPGSASSRRGPRARPWRARRGPAAASRRARALPPPRRPAHGVRAPAGPTPPGSPGRAAGRTAARPCAGRPGRGWPRSAARGHGERLVGEPRADPLARLLHRDVGQADDREGRQAGAQVDLDLDGGCLQAEDGGADEAGDHGRQAPRARATAPHPGVPPMSRRRA